MIRFCALKSGPASKVQDQENHLVFDNSVWEQGKRYFDQHGTIKSVLVTDTQGRPVCLAWQDKMANQELRMLDELVHTEDALPFEAYYPQCDGVIIHGCNELSYQTALYLQTRNIPVALAGPFWEFLDIAGAEETAFSHPLEIYAEGTWEHSGEPWLEATRTVSVEFDCIFKLYMENVKAGKICNTSKTVDEFLGILRKRNVILLGTDAETQDAYDFLAGHDIEIAGFLNGETDREGMKLLGKDILVYNDLRRFSDCVLIDCHNENSVLGGELDYYAYQGFRRDEDYFYLKDYMAVPSTKLAHLLRNAAVVLIGDKLLCRRVRRFLIKNGKPENEVLFYEDIDGKIDEASSWLGVPVVLRNYNTMSWYRWMKEVRACKKALSEKCIGNYTDYFTSFESFIGMEVTEPQALPQELRPKGVLLGCININSGNIFSHDCLDNHPNILHLGFTFLESHLFHYCLRLSEVEKTDIMRTFWTLITPELGSRFAAIFPQKDVFDQACEELLKKAGERPTSQELFVILCVAYSRMMGRPAGNIADYYIWWEPHYVSRDKMQLYAYWLNEANITGFFVYGKRNAVTVRGSIFRHFDREFVAADLLDNNSRTLITDLFNMTGIYLKPIQVPGWQAVVNRFEDIKLKPRETWGKFCNALGIPWSDTLLETTKWGKRSAYQLDSNVVAGYDIKPVYNTYPEYLSALDQLRLCIYSADFQREFGYPYVSCLRFTRKELQELFLKEFKIEKRLRFRDAQDCTEYYLKRAVLMQEYLRELYNRSVFEQIEEADAGERYLEEDGNVRKLRQYGIMETRGKAQKPTEMHPKVKELLADILSVLNSRDKVVLYGLGLDADWLVRHLDSRIQEKLVFCDKKAQNGPVTYLGREVIAPEKLPGAYRDYDIIVMPASCWEAIETELKSLGVEESRIFSNKLPLYMMGYWDLNPVSSMLDQVLGEWI